MMERPTPTRLLLAGAFALAVAPCAARAQRTEVSTRRAARAEADYSTARELRLLQSRADSLLRLYSETDELAERRRVGAELDAAVMRMDVLARRMAASEEHMHVEMRMAPMRGQMFLRTDRAMPRGWLGIVVSGAAREPRVDGDELIVRYLTYPEIVSVDPSSPAERAGLVPSDTLIAYDGRDVRDSDISLTRLLRPNSRVLVRVRRDGRTRDIPVTIADVPSRIKIRREESASESWSSNALAAVGPVPGIPAAPQAPRARAFVIPMPPTPPSLPAPPVVVATPGAAYTMIATDAVAGAELGAVTEGWSKALGVARGAVVLRAPLGSPAERSGLRSGDVIVGANGQSVGTVAQLLRAVGMAYDAGDHALQLTIVRERRTMKLPLRW